VTRPFSPRSQPSSPRALGAARKSGSRPTSWWEKLGYKSAAYEVGKKAILDTTIVQLEQVLPGISSRIKTSEVAAPFTMLRYTNNWKAAPGFMMTKDLKSEGQE